MKLSIDQYIFEHDSWDSLWQKMRLDRDITAVNKGDIFERLTQLYMLKHSAYKAKFKHVWWHALPAPNDRPGPGPMFRPALAGTHRLFKERFAHVRSPTRELPTDGRSPRLRYENQSEKTSAFRRYNRTLRFSSWLSFEARRRHVMV